MALIDFVLWELFGALGLWGFGALGLWGFGALGLLFEALARATHRPVHRSTMQRERRTEGP